MNNAVTQPREAQDLLGDEARAFAYKNLVGMTLNHQTREIVLRDPKTGKVYIMDFLPSAGAGGVVQRLRLE